MFWFLHYAVKVLIGLALVGIGVLIYFNRQWFTPADLWMEQFRRVQTDTVPVQEVVTGRVVRVPSAQRLVVASADHVPRSFEVVGIATPRATPNPRSQQSVASRAGRDFLSDLVLSNQVRIACTLLVPDAGGMGGVYFGDTNVAIPLLSGGYAIVDDTSLRSLPVKEQVELLAAEKVARDGHRGIWTNADLLSEVKKRR